MYKTIAGALQYLTLNRPDLSFAVNQACQHMYSPIVSHFVALKRILRYIKGGTVIYGFHIKKGPLHLSAYSDANSVGDATDRRSTSAFCVFLGPTPVSWCAKKQQTVARSSAEADHKSLAHTAAELSWIRLLLGDTHVFLSRRLTLSCDNISAISLTSKPIFHTRIKHIEVNYHFVREKVSRKDLSVHYISTQDQLADIFTKGLQPRMVAVPQVQAIGA